jgi:hypothetical protein
VAGLDAVAYIRVAPERRARFRRHVSACVAFNYGLLRGGPFRYLYVTARKPV